MTAGTPGIPDPDGAGGVLIVGGGPVGMLLAAEVALHGIAVTVLEAQAEPHDEPRAGTLHARTVQSLTRRGYVAAPSRVTAASTRTLRTPFHYGGRPGLTLEAPESEGPPMIGQSQSEVERFFETRARALGARVLRGHRVCDVAPGPDRVTVRAEHDAGTRTLRAGHLVGCDGARSVVRESVGFPTSTRPATFAGILGLVELPDPAAVPGGWAHGPTGSTLANVNPVGLSRVLTHEFADPLPGRGAPVTLADLAAATSRILGREVPMRRPAYLGRFSDVSRLAEGYRRGRVLLAGDAAHVHAPLGGQGLNTGMQDAFNLGWKLAMVAGGTAPERLLDTYDTERRPVAAAVIADTHVQAALMRPASESLREFVGGLLEVPEVNSRVSRQVTGQGIRYAAGPAGTFLGNAPVGTSTVAELLAPGRPVLLMDRRWSQGCRADRTGPVTVVDVEAMPVAEPAALCRPDGYLAWAGSSPEGLDRALRDWFGTGPAPGAAGVR